MDSAERHLVELATVVADGGEPDWTAASAHADEAAIGVVNRLKTIAAIARLHETFSGTTAGARGAARADRPDPPATWHGLRLLEIIGSGRFGTVYRAFDPALEREVALKLLHAQADDGDAERVIEEGSLAARVRHPNVVAILGARRADGRTGLWMELVRGRTLEAELAAHGQFSIEALRQVAVELARALGAVHGAGLVHRDVKATNVMRDRDGRIVLGDFGTGRSRDESEVRRSGLAGTPSYLAPEIFQGQPATPQSDLYSLGVLLFRLATGQFPVHGRSLRDFHAAHASSPQASVVALRPNLPADLAATINRLIHPDPRRRLTSAAEVERGLSAVDRRWTFTIVAAGLMVAMGAAALLLRGLAPPSAGGIALEQIDPALQKQFALYGPPIDARFFPCRQPSQKLGNVVALCDLQRKTMTTLRAPAKPSARAGPAGPALAGSPGVFVSPDGRQLAYRWDEDGVATIHVVDRDGSRDRELLRGRPAAIQDWTADGRALVLRESTGDSELRILRLPVAGGGPTEIWRGTPGEHLRTALAPDGRTIAVEQRAAGDTETDIVVVDLPGGKELRRLSLPGNQRRPLWTPDGRGLVFLTDHLGMLTLMWLAVERGAAPEPPLVLQTLTRSDTSLVGFAADGTLYLRSYPPARAIWMSRVDLDRGLADSPRLADPTSLEDTMGADWSPDGSTLAYLRGQFGDTSKPGTLVVRHPTDGDRTFPVPGYLQRIGPRVRWAPDGRRIAVLHATTPPPPMKTLGVLSIFHLDETSWQTVTTGNGVRSPAWDPVTGDLFFVENGAIKRFRDATVAEVIPAAAGLANGEIGIDISRDGTMATAVPSGTPPQCLVRLVREPTATNHHRVPGFCTTIGWDAAGTTLLVATQSPAGHVLWALDARQGAPQALPIEASRFWDVSISSEGRLVYTDGDGPAQLWRLTGISSIAGR